jgi:DNA-binding SARP family transcriptional activator
MQGQQHGNHTLRFMPDSIQALWNPVWTKHEADFLACFLGTFRLFRKGERIDLPGGARQRSLLAYLFFHAKEKIHRNKIIRRFWPDHDPECAKNNLNVAICNLRRFLEQYISEEVICFRSEYFYINPALQVHRDMDAFLQAFHQGKDLESQSSTAKAAQWFETAAQMGSEFLEEFLQEDWTVRPREEFTEKLFHALDVLSTNQQEKQQYDAAMETLRSMLYKDDCLESVHSKVMACYLALGKNEMAVRQYHECERILLEKLKMRPSAETEALFQIARGVRRA